MEDIIYNAVQKYLKTIATFGYCSQADVDRLLLLECIYEFTYWDFRGYINKDDYKAINDAIYTIFGTCLVPYPNFCKNKDMNKLHIGDITELAHRVKVNEEHIAEIQQTPVVKTLGDVIEEVEDVPFTPSNETE